MTPTLDRSGTLLPLDEWRRILGWNPWHFWGLANSLTPVNSACNTVVSQHGWQAADAAGRADIVEAIQTAERKLQSYIGFAPAPQFEYDELPFDQYHDLRSAYLSSADALGRWIGVRVKRGKVRTPGVLARTLIGNANVTLSDLDDDGLEETFTLSIATTVTDPDEIAVYFAAGERFDGSGVSERWRVRPVAVSISGGTATITGHAWTIVDPVRYEGVSAGPLDPDDATVFAAQLAVYRLYVDTTEQGAFVWETAPGQCCPDGTGTHQFDPAATNSQAARFVVRDWELGYVAGETASYDADTSEYVATEWPVGYPPTRVRVAYLAGYPLVDGEMASEMKALVSRLATAELSRRICACDVANRELWRWQFDRARAAGANDEQYSISPADLDNPFGTREGHIWAWRMVREYALAGASLV